MTPQEAREQVRQLVTQVEMDGDPRVGIQLVRAKMSELHNAGEEVPKEFIWIEKRFLSDCVEASQGRSPACRADRFATARPGAS